MLVRIQLKEYFSCLWLLRQKLKAATIGNLRFIIYQKFNIFEKKDFLKFAQYCIIKLFNNAKKNE